MHCGLTTGRATSAPGPGSPRPHLRRDRVHPGHICAGTGLAPCHICTGASPQAANFFKTFQFPEQQISTIPPPQYASRSTPHLHRECARPQIVPHLHPDGAHACHICTGTGLTRGISASGLARLCCVCAGNLARPCDICTGTGLTPLTSAPEQARQSNIASQDCTASRRG